MVSSLEMTSPPRPSVGLSSLASNRGESVHELWQTVSTITALGPLTFSSRTSLL